ncbi:hypothetical protein AWB71_03282 [Caballeronia peredens]|nr:hypothetical protein AWB71_03282 [Caballeronia peredens]
MSRLVDTWPDHDDLLLRDLPDDEEEADDEDDDRSDEWFQRYED